MIIDITEEEREFLERICTRAEIFARKGLGQRPMEKDVKAIVILKRKFRELDANLINRVLKDDN